ncbi:unnamed protein product, partial [Oncorhynchus mykiss]
CVSRGGQVWAPEGSTAFKCLLSARFCAALLSNISDCDETYNYWEPMHFLLYGYGMQTWEYSPLNAIRSYGYLWLHALPASLHSHILQTNKVLVFYFVRCVLAFSCCICELYFYKAVCKKFGLHVGRLMLAFLLLSSGMFCSSAGGCYSYLPPSPPSLFLPPSLHLSSSPLPPSFPFSISHSSSLHLSPSPLSLPLCLYLCL